MTERISYPQLYKLHPTLANALIDLGEAAATKLEHSLVHLIRLRASQLNSCAYCQHLHVNAARKGGETQTRLDLLATWSNVPLFSARERAALQWTEQLTLLNPQGIQDQDYAALQAQFTEEEIVNLTAAIVTINSWNRIALGFHFLPSISN